MKVDVHAHYIPETFVRPADNGFGVQIGGNGDPEAALEMFVRAAGFDGEQLYSIGRRLSDMRAQGVDMHVLSPPPHLFLYSLDPDRALALCRRINDAFAETVRRHAQSFVAIADVPLQSPEAAAGELERAVKELGMRGVEICSNVNGMNLDDRGLWPFYAKMQELDVPAFIHPSGVLGADRLRNYYLVNLIGNPTDTAVAAASLIFGGVLKEFPRIKFYLAHGGGSCPFIRGRWEHGWRVRPEGKLHIEKPPSEYFGQLYFDSLVHDLPALNYLVDTVGPERVMLGTDYPFDMGDYDSVRTIGSLPHRSAAEKERVYGGNAAGLFRLEA